jgi:hypothetical protein
MQHFRPDSFIRWPMLAAHGLGPRAGREGVEREKSDASS